MIFHVITNHANIPLSSLGPEKKLICTSAETITRFTGEQLFRFQADLGLINRQMGVHEQHPILKWELVRERQ